MTSIPIEMIKRKSIPGLETFANSNCKKSLSTLIFVRDKMSSLNKVTKDHISGVTTRIDASGQYIVRGPLVAVV